MYLYQRNTFNSKSQTGNTCRHIQSSRLDHCCHANHPKSILYFRLRDLMRQPPGMVTTALRNGCVTGQTCMGWSWVVKLVIHGKVDTTSIGKQCCAEYYFEYFNFIFISFGSRSTKLFGFRVQSVQTCLYNLIIVQ